MVETGDEAPDFTVPLANDDVEAFTLSDHLGEAPIVLAFFPAAFTGTCTDELCAFRDQLANFEDVGATVYGISVDLPYTLNAFRDQNDLEFGLLSDERREVIDDYDVASSFPPLDIRVAQRSVFVIDESGTVSYRWLSDDPGQEPDSQAVRAAAAEAGD